MTDLWFTLLCKSTVLLALGCMAAWVCRSLSAAMRHLVWLSVLVALLLLPVGWLLPNEGMPPDWSLAIGVTTSVINDVAILPNAGTLGMTTIWAVGLALLLIRLGVAVLHSAQLVRTAYAVSTIDDYPVRLTQDLSSPAAWHLGAGTVLLPQAATEWPQERLRAALWHEAAHLARRDCWALLIGELACAVYWFHPGVWYAVRCLRTEQEHAADDAVLQRGLTGNEYAAQLVKLATSHRNALVLAGAGTQSLLSARVKALLNPERNRTMQTRKMLIATAVAAMTLTLPVVAMQANRPLYKTGQDGVIAPRIIHRQHPEYSKQAKEAGVSGVVKLSAVIEADGSVSHIHVQEGLEPSLDDSAAAALQAWQFVPAEKDGKPVAVAFVAEISFRLVE